MATSELSNLPMPGSPPGGPAGSGPSGWLSPHSVFEQKTTRRMGGAFGVSLAVHAALFLLLALGIRQAVINQIPDTPLTFVPVFLNTPGPGGGGGGNPAPAPPKKLEMPKPKPVESIPVPVPVPVEPPPPSLTAPVQTNVSVLQATGANSISISQLGGGGRGSGIGPGTGSGLGPGEGGGTGGGIYAIGNGVNSPELITKVDPVYTSDAMRAKLQGEVVLNAVVETNGLLSGITVAKSLDRTFGLDEAAKSAALKWRFKPGTKDGKPVRVQVQLILEFRLH